MRQIKYLQKWLENNKLDAFIVYSGDPHFNEYVQDHFASRAWISGFTGSAGTIVVTREKAALWTDSRYFIQAEDQLAGSGIELMRVKMKGTPSLEEWLQSSLLPGARVGINPALLSKDRYDTLSRGLGLLDLVQCEDPFRTIWKDRPPLVFGKGRLVSIELSGMDTKEKLGIIREKLSMDKDYLYILPVCDDIAWLFNIRGSDIPYNPLLLSYAVFTRESAILFTGKESFDAEMRRMLAEGGIEVEDYDEFERYIASFDRSFVRIAPPEKISVKHYELCVKDGAEFYGDKFPGGVVGSVKAVKNDIEMAGFGRAMEKDAIAWIKWWIFFEKALALGGDLTECALAEKLIALRSECADYMGESFSPIVAYGNNAALPHYSPYGRDEKVLNTGFLLVDSGAQYPYGTTDTTRTFAIGKLSEEQKRDYTLVLKGMISLSKAVFPKGTRGASLDFLARGAVCSSGKLYLHGTGHGIGHNLCVHEGPQSIRMEENPVEIVPGMVVSNEPAVYEDGKYGIRIENVLVCRKYIENSFGIFYCFNTLTLIPIDKSGIDRKLFGDECAEWLDDYHKEVYSRISPFLDEEERLWLLKKCSDLD